MDAILAQGGVVGLGLGGGGGSFDEEVRVNGFNVIKYV